MYIRYHIVRIHVYSNIGMYIRCYMVRNHIKSNIDRVSFIYIRFSMVRCHRISNMLLSRFFHIRYYIASNHGKSNIYSYTLYIYSNFDDWHTIEYRICEKQENTIFDIRWCAGHVISNMEIGIFDIICLGCHINSNMDGIVSHLISNIVDKLRILGIYIRFSMTYRTIGNRISPSKIEFLDIRS